MSWERQTPTGNRALAPEVASHSETPGGRLEMNKPFGNVVFPVIASALDLKDRLDRGEIRENEMNSRIETEQRKLLELLRADGEIRRQVDYSGDGGVFLGARYALCCWIDELFIVHTHAPWSDLWKERILELAVFGLGNSAWKFWEQLDVVLKHPNTPRPSVAPGLDALETFFLCVTLGFRGKYLDDPAKVREYIEEMRPQLSKLSTFEAPRELGVTTNVEPLVGRQKLKSVILIYGSVLLVLMLVLLVLGRLMVA
jgi:type VI secretion system protein ImpK